MEYHKQPSARSLKPVCTFVHHAQVHQSSSSSDDLESSRNLRAVNCITTSYKIPRTGVSSSQKIGLPLCGNGGHRQSLGQRKPKKRPRRQSLPVQVADYIPEYPADGANNSSTLFRPARRDTAASAPLISYQTSGCKITISASKRSSSYLKGMYPKCTQAGSEEDVGGRTAPPGNLRQKEVVAPMITAASKGEPKKTTPLSTLDKKTIDLKEKFEKKFVNASTFDRSFPITSSPLALHKGPTKEQKRTEKKVHVVSHLEEPIDTRLKNRRRSSSLQRSQPVVKMKRDGSTPVSVLSREEEKYLPSSSQGRGNHKTSTYASPDLTSPSKLHTLQMPMPIQPVTARVIRIHTPEDIHKQSDATDKRQMKSKVSKINLEEPAKLFERGRLRDSRRAAKNSKHKRTLSVPSEKILEIKRTAMKKTSRFDDKTHRRSKHKAKKRDTKVQEQAEPVLSIGTSSKNRELCSDINTEKSSGIQEMAIDNNIDVDGKRKGDVKVVVSEAGCEAKRATVTIKTNENILNEVKNKKSVENPAKSSTDDISRIRLTMEKRPCDESSISFLKKLKADDTCEVAGRAYSTELDDTNAQLLNTVAGCIERLEKRQMCGYTSAEHLQSSWDFANISSIHLVKSQTRVAAADKVNERKLRKVIEEGNFEPTQHSVMNSSALWSTVDATGDCSGVGSGSILPNCGYDVDVIAGDKPKEHLAPSNGLANDGPSEPKAYVKEPRPVSTSHAITATVHPLTHDTPHMETHHGSQSVYTEDTGYQTTPSATSFMPSSATNLAPQRIQMLSDQDLQLMYSRVRSVNHVMPTTAPVYPNNGQPVASRMIQSVSVPGINVISAHHLPTSTSQTPSVATSPSVYSHDVIGLAQHPTLPGIVHQLGTLTSDASSHMSNHRGHQMSQAQRIPQNTVAALPPGVPSFASQSTTSMITEVYTLLSSANKIVDNLQQQIHCKDAALLHMEMRLRDEMERRLSLETRLAHTQLNKH